MSDTRYEEGLNSLECSVPAPGSPIDPTRLPSYDIRQFSLQLDCPVEKVDVVSVNLLSSDAFLFAD